MPTYARWMSVERLVVLRELALELTCSTPDLTPTSYRASLHVHHRWCQCSLCQLDSQFDPLHRGNQSLATEHD